MSLRDDFPGYAFDIPKDGQTRITDWEAGREVIATAQYTISPTLSSKADGMLKDWDEKFSYMIGLYLPTTVQKFEVAYKDHNEVWFDLIVNGASSKELNDTLGYDSGRKWHGLLAPFKNRHFRPDFAKNLVGFDVRLRVSPLDAKVNLFIPFVGCYRFDAMSNPKKFSDGYMASVWRVPPLDARDDGTYVFGDARGTYMVGPARKK